MSARYTATCCDKGLLLAKDKQIITVQWQHIKNMFVTKGNGVTVYDIDENRYVARLNLPKDKSFKKHYINIRDTWSKHIPINKSTSEFRYPRKHNLYIPPGKNLDISL